MPIIDAQVHAYERDHADRPWAGTLAGPAEVTGSDMVVAMDAAGVDGAVIVSPDTMDRYDASYAFQTHAAHPCRFCLFKPVDPSDPGVAETVADWAKIEGAVAVRIMPAYGVSTDPDHASASCILRAAADCGLPVNLLCRGLFGQALALAKAHPDTRLVVDDLGLKQPFDPLAPPEPFADLPALLAYAQCENAIVKIRAPARSRTRLTPMTTSGTRSAASSSASASTAASGARTGPAPSTSSPTNRAWSRSAGRTG